MPGACTSAGTRRKPRKAPDPKRKTKALKTATLALLVSLSSFGVYHVAELGEESLWRTAAVCQAYMSSSLQPLQQQERLHFPGGDWKTQRPAGDELGEALSKTLTLEEQLRKLRQELYHLRWSVKEVAEHALQEAVKQAKLPGFTRWAVQDIINQVLEKLEENQAPMPDYALKSSGAAVIHSKTSPSFRNTKGKVFLYSLPLLDYPENHPGNCWPFAGGQGHVFIKLSVPIIPRAVTMDHVSGRTFHRDGISGAPKDFAVYGLKEEHEEQGTFLGQFTFRAVLNPSQTFQLKNEPSVLVNYLRLQVLSNWGRPDYTCLYRFRVHGDPPQDGGKAVTCEEMEACFILTYDTVTFNGLHISLGDLKHQITGREKLKAANRDLQITNAQTKEEYTDEMIMP